MKRKITAIILMVVLVLALAIPMASVGASPGPDIVGLWHLDDGSGTTATDDSGNNNDGTIYGANWVSGMFDQALSFDGSSGYVGISDPDGAANLDGFSALTLEAWIYPNTVTGHQAIISKYNNFGAYDTSYYLSLDGDEVRIYVRQDNSSRAYASTTGANLTAGTWYHVAGTWDGSVLKLYVDGSLEPSTTTTSGDFPTTMQDTSVDVELGAFQKNGGGNRFAYFDGIIDEVRIWDEALTADEVFQSYIGPVVTTAITDGPDEVEVNDEVSWNITINVYAGPLGNTDVVVQDGMGADLDQIEFDGSSVNPGENIVVTPGTAYLVKKGKGKNKMGANMVIWEVGDLAAGDPATLVVTVTTGLNARAKKWENDDPPNKWHEFTEAETGHELDGGASATYYYTEVVDDEDVVHQYQTPETVPLTVDVV